MNKHIPSPTPTAKQIEALQAVAAGNVAMKNVGTAAFRIFGATPQVIGRLVSLGWAKWPKGAIGDQACELTDAGRHALDLAS